MVHLSEGGSSVGKGTIPDHAFLGLNHLLHMPGHPMLGQLVPKGQSLLDQLLLVFVLLFFVDHFGDNELLLAAVPVKDDVLDKGSPQSIRLFLANPLVLVDRAVVDERVPENRHRLGVKFAK